MVSWIGKPCRGRTRWGNWEQETKYLLASAEKLFFLKEECLLAPELVGELKNANEPTSLHSADKRCRDGVRRWFQKRKLRTSWQIAAHVSTLYFYLVKVQEDHGSCCLDLWQTSLLLLPSFWKTDSTWERDDYTSRAKSELGLGIKVEPNYRNYQMLVG